MNKQTTVHVNGRIFTDIPLPPSFTKLRDTLSMKEYLHFYHGVSVTVNDRRVRVLLGPGHIRSTSGVNLTTQEGTEIDILTRVLSVILDRGKGP